ncbi:MAG TPA: 30S ribosomal protein S6 [Bryobacteraceae bacterium]|nr:30S ribosomal protein S6 [Bryobacteraceae bacterium]
MRVYEELFIVKPDSVEEEVDAYIDQLKTLIATGKGTVDKVDKWGVRKLAYRVAKCSEGQYILIQFSASPEAVKEIERRMRVTDMVIKFITVRIDEKQKKIDKRKKAREKRAARKPAPQAAPAVPAAPALPGEPAAAGPGLPGTPAPEHPAPAAPVAPAAPAAEEVKG